MANKVLFGFSDLYVGTYEVGANNAVTLGTPYHQKGAVGYSPSESTDKADFYADNIAYYTTYNNEGVMEGDLTVAMFDDAFKTQFLGYVQLDDGGLARVKGAQLPNVYMMFEVQGDAEGRRVIIYNGTFGPINREYATIEETKTPQTESVPTTFYGDNETGITMVVYKESDSGYATLFSNPPVPTLPSESS